MSFLLNQFALAFFNLVNSRIDAYRILKHKEIAHGINFAAYAAFTGLLIWLSDLDFPNAFLFCISAFLNRQLSFDIPLNLRRGLKWYYQSMADPPKALWDKIERKIFGIDYDGKKIAVIYSLFLVWTFFIKIIVL